MRQRNSDPPGKPPRRAHRNFASKSSADIRGGGDFAATGSGARLGGREPAKFHQKSYRGAHRRPARDDGVVLYGWHTVKAALQNPRRRFHSLLATENAARRLAEDGVILPLEAQIGRPEVIAGLAGPEAVHQGLYARCDPLPSPDIEEIAGSGIILALDQITDPHNVGAILRSAAAFAVTAVVTTERHSPEATGVLAKAASGALEYVPITTVGNLARALDTLREHHTLVVGLDSAGEADLAEIALAAPMALVIGAEGKGLRHLTRMRCDVVARLKLPGRITALNVSNATAIALHVASAKLAAAT